MVNTSEVVMRFTTSCCTFAAAALAALSLTALPASASVFVTVDTDGISNTNSSNSLLAVGASQTAFTDGGVVYTPDYTPCDSPPIFFSCGSPAVDADTRGKANMSDGTLKARALVQADFNNTSTTAGFTDSDVFGPSKVATIHLGIGAMTAIQGEARSTLSFDLICKHCFFGDSSGPVNVTVFHFSAFKDRDADEEGFTQTSIDAAGGVHTEEGTVIPDVIDATTDFTLFVNFLSILQGTANPLVEVEARLTAFAECNESFNPPPLPGCFAQTIADETLTLGMDIVFSANGYQFPGFAAAAPGSAPEPGGLAVLGLALVGLGLIRRRAA